MSQRGRSAELACVATHERRTREHAGEADMADLNMEEYFASGAVGDFFQEMMAETGMAEEMMMMPR